ncbi:hypothetical protein ABL57_17360, partial [Kocuria sp. SM24M-10]
MKISALRIPAALAACFAVVLAGAPGASAAPPSPAPDVATAPAATDGTATATATTTATAAPLDPVDDAMATAGPGRTAAVDVLANDGLLDPAQVRLLLVDPSAPRGEDALADELRTDVGSLRVITPGTAPAELPEGWLPPEHPVLALTPAEDAPAGAVEVGYALRDATGGEARAVVTVTPRVSADPSPSTGPAEQALPTPEALPEPASEPAAVPSTGPATESSEGARAADAQADVTTDVPAEARQALEAAAVRVAARSGGPTADMRPWKGGWEWPHQNGVVLWHAAHGAHFVQVRGAIGQKWLSDGDVDLLGWPLGDEVCGLAGRGCRQSFSGDRTIYWTASTGARTVNTYGAIGSKWVLGGRETGVYGYPTTDEVCGLAGRGCRQSFSGDRTIY